MNDLRRMSYDQAAEVADKLASEFFSQFDAKGWTGELGRATPDPIETVKIGKVQRYWVALVQWSKDGSVMDGPSVINIDLSEQRCDWL